jgi:hypothetical protein
MTPSGARSPHDCACVDAIQDIRASSAVSTGMVPVLTMCFSPRTAAAELVKDLRDDEPIAKDAARSTGLMYRSGCVPLNSCTPTVWLWHRTLVLPWCRSDRSKGPHAHAFGPFSLVRDDARTRRTSFGSCWRRPGHIRLR